MKTLSKANQLKLANQILDKEDITLAEFIYAIDVIDASDVRFKKFKQHARQVSTQYTDARSFKTTKPGMRDIDKIVVLNHNIGCMNDDTIYNKWINDDIKSIELEFKSK